MSDNITLNSMAGGATVATDDCGAGGQVQIIKLAISTDGSATLIPADATNGIDVDVTRLPALPAGTNNIGDVDVLSSALPAGASTLAEQQTQTTALQLIDDTIFADDAGFTAGTSKVGMQGVYAVAVGSAPDQADANDAAAPVATRNRVPFTMGGDPATITLKHTTITTAVTDAAIITVSTGNKIVVTRLTITLDNASTVFPTVLIGFGATNTPTTTGVLYSHGGFPAGGGQSVGDGSGIIGIGADGDDLRVSTTGNATGNGLQITVSYHLLPS